jgi:hypothetical protein
LEQVRQARQSPPANADAVRLYAAAFAADLTLAAEPRAYARYNAACRAALAAAGADADADRARLRALALGWLREQFADETRRAAVRSYPSWARDETARRLRHWQEDADLSGVRDADALEKLPAAERAAWRQLWADADALLREAAPGREKALDPRPPQSSEKIIKFSFAFDRPEA